MENKTAIKVIDGKLIQGIRIIAPEIGNPEHIKAIKDYENRLTEQLKIARGEGLYVNVELSDITTFPLFSFECVCGEDMDELRQNEVTCPKCGREYTIKNGCAKLIE